MWNTETTEILRILIGDYGATELYTDASLLRIILVAALQVSVEMEFSQNFIVDIDAQTITPDPSSSADNTRDESFLNLTTLKAACIIDRAAAIDAATKAIAGKDGFSSYDLREVAKAKISLLTEGGYCVAYEKAKKEYKTGLVRVAGAVVMGPFRTAAGYYTPINNY